MYYSTLQREACLNAWLHCEDIINSLPNTEAHPEAHSIFNECSTICLGMLRAIREKSINAEKLAILCVGICEECAEYCDEFHSALFRKCADACRKTADAFSAVAYKAIA